MKKITLLFTLLFFFSWHIKAQITVYPYLEDFESGPGSWVADNTTNGTWAMGTPAATIINSAASGTNAWVTNLTGDYNISEDAWVSGPVFDFSSLSSPRMQLSVWWNCEFSWDGLVLQSSIDGATSWQNVGAMGTGSNWYTDNTIGGNPGGQPEGWSGRNSTTNGSGMWVTASHDLTGLAGQTSILFRLAFGSDGSVQDEGVAFDDINIFEVTCPQPTAQMAANITATSADLSWTESGTATLWDIELGTTGFVPTGTPTSTSVANPHNATSLTSATTYDFYVRSDCGGLSGTSMWSGPYTFTTTCTVFMAPYSETFDNPATPICWTQSATTGGPWVFGQLGSADYASTIFDDNTGNGGYFAWMDFSGTDAGVVLEMPDVDVTSLTTPTLYFDLASYNTDNNDSNILFVEAWDGAAWQQLTMIEQDDSLWNNHIYSLVGMTYGANLARVRYRAEPDANGTAVFYNDLLIDNVRIDAAVSVRENVTNINLSVYPNPTNGLITLNVNTTDVNELEIKVINIQGQVVFSKNNFDNISNVNEQIDLSNNANGIYFITITTDNGVKTSKIIVQ